MTEKTKKTLVIAAGSAACIALAVGIAMRFGGNTKAPQGEIPSSAESGSSSVIVDIDETDPTPTPEINIDKPASTPDPGAGVDSTGTEQSIQADPVKSEQPEPPKPPMPAAQKDQEHTGEDVPESDRNTPEPPKYEQPPKPEPPAKPENNEPAPGSTNHAGQVYVPGFGYIDKGGPNDGGTLDDMYENGNKIGEMG